MRHKASEQPIHLNLDQKEDIQKHTILARESLHAGHFSYSFKRMFVEPHPESCVCVACRFNHTLESYECLDFFSDLTGIKLMKIKETFLSIYQKNDWLSVHHDHNKGKIAFVFNFSKNWNVAHGADFCICRQVDNWTKIFTRLSYLHLIVLVYLFSMRQSQIRITLCRKSHGGIETDMHLQDGWNKELISVQ